MTTETRESIAHRIGRTASDHVARGMTAPDKGPAPLGGAVEAQRRSVIGGLGSLSLILAIALLVTAPTLRASYLAGAGIVVALVMLLRAQPTQPQPRAK